MLSKIRKNLRAFSLPLWIVAASFVGTIFLVWGRGSVLGPSGTEVATVNGEGISLVEFNREYSNITNELRTKFGENYRKFIKDDEVKQAALRRLIVRKLLLQTAKEEGIQVSDWAVARAIEEIPAFQDNGTFSVKLYRSFLKARHITPKSFEDVVREDLLINKVLSVINNSPSITKFELKKLYTSFFGKRKFKYKLFPLKDFNVSVSGKEIEEYYKKNREEFSKEGEFSNFVLTFPKTVKGEKEAQKAFEIARSGKFSQLFNFHPKPLKDKNLEKELQKKPFTFKSSDRELLLAFRYRRRKYKPLSEVKQEIETILKMEKALKKAEKAAKSYKGELPNETEFLDRSEFVKKFKPLELPEELYSSPVGVRKILRLENGFGIFSPETDLKVEKFDKEKMEKLKKFVITQKRETNYQNFVNLLLQRATVKINEKLFRSIK